MLDVCRCLLRLGFRVCSYDLLLLAGYACMQKMVSCCVLGCWCLSLLRLGFRFVHMICFCLLVMHVCEKMVSCCVLGCWCQSLFHLGFRLCLYDLLLLAGYACMQKSGFLLCSGLLISIFHPPMSSFYLENCVFQNYTQRTT